MENVMKRVNYYITVIQLNKLKMLSNDTGLSVSEHIRRAIDLYLEETKDDWKLRKKILEKGRQM
jgi:predicted DNA-binding protein